MDIYIFICIDTNILLFWQSLHHYLINSFPSDGRDSESIKLFGRRGDLWILGFTMICYKITNYYYFFFRNC